MADGEESFIGILRVDLTYSIDDATYHESTLTPLFRGKALGEIGAFGQDLAETVARGVSKQGLAATPANKSTCQVYCQMDHIDRIDSCTDRANACIGTVGAGALACIGTCAAVAPALLPACVALCVGGEALLIVACLLDQRACIRDAARDFRNCMRDCPIPDL